MIRTLAVASLLLLPLSALAEQPQCTFNEPRDLKLDLAGAKAVVFEVNQHDLVLTAGGGAAQLSGRACASNADWLRQLTVTQQKVGDKLVLEAGSEITLKGGGSFVKVDPSGIKLVGPAIKLNAGGSAGSGSGWAGQAPVVPKGVEVVKAPELVELIMAIPTEKAMEALLKEEKPGAFYLFSE